MRNFGPCRDSKFRLEPDELSLSGYGFRNPRDYPDAIGIIICYTHLRGALVSLPPSLHLRNQKMPFLKLGKTDFANLDHVVRVVEDSDSDGQIKIFVYLAHFESDLGSERTPLRVIKLQRKRAGPLLDWIKSSDVIELSESNL